MVKRKPLASSAKSASFPLSSRNGVLSAIGNTPLVELSDSWTLATFDCSPNWKLVIQAEVRKIGPQFRCLPNDRKRAGRSTTIIESSSGNMESGLAQACRYFDLPFVCVVDPRAQPQNVAIMRALGATIDVVEQPLDGDFLAAACSRVSAPVIPDSYWTNQYSNAANPRSHAEGTVREIDDALAGDLDYLFVATSSTGAAQGCRDYLRDKGRSTKVIAVDATGSVLFGGTAGPRMIPGLMPDEFPHWLKSAVR
ncbi:MAG: pyridoxal-phosphate dependent enzyme [Pirellulaceae bacterium]